MKQSTKMERFLKNFDGLFTFLTKLKARGKMAGNSKYKLNDFLM